MSLVIKTRQEEREYVDDVVCNRCGKTTKMGYGFEGINFHAEWGYGSHRDGERWTGDLCLECSELFEQWMGGKIDKTPPEWSFGDKLEAHVNSFERIWNELKGG